MDSKNTKQTMQSSTSTQASVPDSRGNKQLIDSKLTQTNWNDVEKRFSNAFDTAVLESLDRYTTELINGSGKKGMVRSKILKALGNKFYNKIREQLFDAKLVVRREVKFSDETKTTKKAKNVKKKGMNADEIREKNAFSKVEHVFTDCLSDLKMDRFTPQRALQSDIVEVIGIGFMYMLRFMVHHKKKYSTGSRYVEVLSLFVSTQRFINQCRTYEGYDLIKPSEISLISTQLLEDLQHMYNLAEREFPFDGLTVYEIAPQLLVWSDLDQYIPNMGITPRGHQKDLMDRLYESMDSGMLAVYRAMIGSGKTTVIRSIASMVGHLKKNNPKYRHLQAIFCCNLQSVKLQVGQICYNANIPFAMASVDGLGGYRIINNFNCKKESERLVIICSPDVAQMILNDLTYDNDLGKTYDRFILFHDEPTIGADCKGSIGLENNVETMLSLPKWSILSSATFPPIEELSPIIDKARRENPNVNVVDITSTEIQIGCDVRTFNGDIVVPYMGCSTSDDLKHIIALIRQTPFMGKQLTNNVALTLYKKCTDQMIPGIPNIPDLFKNAVNMKTDNVRETILDILTILSNQSDQMIQTICHAKIGESEGKLHEEGAEVDEKHDAQRTESPHQINIQNIGTTDAWKLSNMTLIATNQPDTMARIWFADILKELSDHGIKNAYKLLSKYSKEVEAFNEQLDRIISKLKTDDHRTGSDGKQRDASGDDKQRKRSELEADQPKLDFPEWAHIGTREHIKYFSKNRRVNCYRSALVLENLQLDDLLVPDEFILLLMCGVGCYYPDSKLFDERYTALVLKLASEGKLAYCIADNSISYGTNYPINRVIVMDDFSSTHSVNTLFQLMGRAGRVGRSWRAEAFISNDMARTLIDYSMHPERYSCEVENIKDMVHQIHRKHEQSIQDTMDQLHKEATELIKGRKERKIVQVQLPTPIETPKKNSDQLTDYASFADTSDLIPIGSIERRNKGTPQMRQDDQKEIYRQRQDTKVSTPQAYVPPHLRKSQANSTPNNSANRNDQENWRKKEEPDEWNQGSGNRRKR